MPISLEMEYHVAYLAALLAGAFALDEAQAVSLRFLEASLEHHLPNVLVDVRQVEGRLTVAERYEYSIFMAREVVDRSVRFGGLGVRLAYVGYEPLIDPHRFGVVVARNRGALVLATEHLNEALNWLGVTPTST